MKTSFMQATSTFYLFKHHFLSLETLTNCFYFFTCFLTYIYIYTLKKRQCLETLKNKVPCIYYMIYIYIYIFYIYACMHACVCVYIYIYIYICMLHTIHIYIYIYIYIHTYTHMYVCDKREVFSKSHFNIFFSFKFRTYFQ